MYLGLADTNPLPADCDTHSEQCDWWENMFHCENILVVDSQGDEDGQKRPGKKRYIFGNHRQQWWEETVHILWCSLKETGTKEEEEKKYDLFINYY